MFAESPPEKWSVVSEQVRESVPLLRSFDPWMAQLINWGCTCLRNIIVTLLSKGKEANKFYGC